MVQNVKTTSAQLDHKGIGQIRIVLKNGKVKPLSPESWTVCCLHIQNQMPAGFRC